MQEGNHKFDTRVYTGVAGSLCAAACFVYRLVATLVRSTHWCFCDEAAKFGGGEHLHCRSGMAVRRTGDSLGDRKDGKGELATGRRASYRKKQRGKNDGEGALDGPWPPQSSWWWIALIGKRFARIFRLCRDLAGLDFWLIL